MVADENMNYNLSFKYCVFPFANVDLSMYGRGFDYFKNSTNHLILHCEYIKLPCNVYDVCKIL